MLLEPRWASIRDASYVGLKLFYSCLNASNFSRALSGESIHVTFSVRRENSRRMTRSMGYGSVSLASLLRDSFRKSHHVDAFQVVFDVDLKAFTARVID